MSSNLCSLAYFSRNALQGTAAEVTAQIRDILVVARRKNPQQGVTGALLFSDGCFAQVLEGPADAVEAIFETIQCDPRHCDVTLLSLHPVAERSFGTWSMAFGGLDGVSLDPAPGDAALDQADAILATGAGQQLLAALRDVVRRDDVARRLAADGSGSAR